MKWFNCFKQNDKIHSNKNRIRNSSVLFWFQFYLSRKIVKERLHTKSWVLMMTFVSEFDLIKLLFVTSLLRITITNRITFFYCVFFLQYRSRCFFSICFFFLCCARHSKQYILLALQVAIINLYRILMLQSNQSPPSNICIVSDITPQVPSYPSTRWKCM